MYEGLSYKLSVAFSEKYPYEPPTVKFVTSCFHPNVDTAGNICLDILKVRKLPHLKKWICGPLSRCVRDCMCVCVCVCVCVCGLSQDKWSAAFSVRTVLMSLQSLLGGTMQPA